MAASSGHLRPSLQSRLLDQMIRNVGSPADKWKVLVVDRAALRILAAALQINKLVDEGITIVEMLDMRREPLPRLPAIYFVTPTAESVQLLVQESHTQYKHFHFFFTSRLPDFLMTVLRENTSLLRKVKTFVELGVQFLALESRLFSLDRPASSIPQLHSESQKETRDEMAIISERLTEVCATVAPGIDWCVKGEATSTTSRTVASLVKEQLQTARLEPQGKPNQNPSHEEETSSESPNTPTKATLLIVDRVSDLSSPLLHEFSYQAMAHDLLKLDYRKPGGAHIDVPNDKDKEKIVSMQLDEEEKDPVWSSARFMFIEEALKHSQECFKSFLETDPAFKIRGKGGTDVDIKDMGAAVRALPESQMRADKHALHITAARECLANCAEMHLSELALVEQDLVLGRVPDGTKIRAEHMVESILKVVGNEDIPTAHRARLIMIAFVIREGLPGLYGENSALVNSASFSSRLRRSGFDKLLDTSSDVSAAVKGLQMLLATSKAGIENCGAGRAFRHPEDEETVTSKLKQRYANRNAQKQSAKLNAARHRRHGLHEEGDLHYDVARYHPPLRSVMMDLIDDELDSNAFPTTGSVSVDSIIASIGKSSLEPLSENETSTGDSHGNRKHKGNNFRTQSIAVSGLVKSIASRDSHKKGNSEEDESRFRLADADHLYVVFVIGGVCYSEVRAMYEVCAKRKANILIGGSQVITPKTFVDSLAALADPVIRIRVMLPPLPLELAQTRAARARTIEAGSAKAALSKQKMSQGSFDTGQEDLGDGADEEDPDNERVGAEVEVVTGYKKSRAKRLFGRMKK